MPVAETPPEPEPKQLAKILIQKVSDVAAAKFGKRYVWAPTVKSSEEMVAVKALVVVVDCGLIAIESAPEVVEEKVVEPVVALVIVVAPDPAFKAIEVEEAVLPIVMVSAAVPPVPILITSAAVAPVPAMLIV